MPFTPILNLPGNLEKNGLFFCFMYLASILSGCLPLDHCFRFFINDVPLILWRGDMLLLFADDLKVYVVVRLLWTTEPSWNLPWLAYLVYDGSEHSSLTTTCWFSTTTGWEAYIHPPLLKYHRLSQSPAWVRIQNLQWDPRSVVSQIIVLLSSILDTRICICCLESLPCCMVWAVWSCPKKIRQMTRWTCLLTLIAVAYSGWIL